MSQQSLSRDSIFALSSGSLPSGVAVIRISGPHVRGTLDRLVGGAPASRTASLRRIVDLNGTGIDRGLVLFFEGPASFTGEDSAELHVHGGKAVVGALLSVLGSLPGLRSAEAGEFTRRAFLNGKIDLTGAEALADLISAETEAQRRLALVNAEGGQQRLYAAWRGRLLHARAMIEAELDFADEADVPGSVAGDIWEDMARLSGEIDGHVGGFHAAEIVRDGFRVVLVGAPNAGKSSLLNALARRDVAIVTEIPGTTRDLVEAVLDLDGLKVVVTDTAGIRQTADIIERIGVDKALAAAGQADLILELVDSSGDQEVPSHERWDAPSLRISTKSDLSSTPATASFDHAISSRTGTGLPALIEAISARASEAVSATSSIVPSRLRQVELLRACRAHIDLAIQGEIMDLELRAEELRLAGDALGRVTGAIDVEDLLGVIFSEFCIGK